MSQITNSRASAVMTGTSFSVYDNIMEQGSGGVLSAKPCA